MGFRDFYQGVTSGRLAALATDGELDEAAKLRQELDATVLFCHTMYEYLRRRGLLDEAEFAALYEELDLGDGRRDHRAGDRTLPATDGRAGGGD